MTDAIQTREAALHSLLLELFSPQELRVFLGRHFAKVLHNLPEQATPDVLAYNTAAALSRRNLIDHNLFAALLEERPRQQTLISACATSCNAAPVQSQLPPSAQQSTDTTVVLPLVSRLPGVEELLQGLQDPVHYASRVLELRRRNVLNTVVAYRLAQILADIDTSLHVRPVQMGDPNGRFNITCYLPGRSLIHIEFIASAECNLAFRSTTEILGSDADTKLTILMDADADEAIVHDYKLAVPGRSIPWFFLRMLLRDAEKVAVVETIRQLISEAQFRSGDIHLGGFACIPATVDLRPGLMVELTFTGITVPQSVQLLIRPPEEDPILFATLDLTPEHHTVAVQIPNSPLLRLGRCRLEARLGDGRRAACHVMMVEQIPPPRLILDKSRCKLGDTVTAILVDFQSDQPLPIIFMQGSGGWSIANAERTGTSKVHTVALTVPRLVMGERTTPGYHKLMVSEGFAQAEAFLFIEPSDTPCTAFAIKAGNLVQRRMADVSLIATNVQVTERLLTVDIELMTFSSGLWVSGWFGLLVDLHQQERTSLLSLHTTGRHRFENKAALANRVAHPYHLEFSLHRWRAPIQPIDLPGHNYVLEIQCIICRPTHHFDPNTISISLSPDEVSMLMEQADEVGGIGA